MEKEKNNLAEVVFILDKSGSMHGYEQDTIGGFNSVIDSQKEKDGKVLVSLVLFNQQTQVVYDRQDINNVSPLTQNEYKAGGSTALLDALGGAIRHIGNIHKYARKEDVPTTTTFIITTDGMENSSYMFDSDKVKQMIKNQTEKYGWEFVFMAANIDAVQTAKKYGIKEDRAVKYEYSAEGVASCYSAMSEIVACRRTGTSLDRSAFKDKVKKADKKQ